MRRRPLVARPDNIVIHNCSVDGVDSMSREIIVIVISYIFVHDFRFSSLGFFLPVESEMMMMMMMMTMVMQLYRFYARLRQF